MTLKQTKQRGFTIVELLIVVVIIAILAAITIVAYNGIQNRAKTGSAQAAASSFQKKLEAYAVELGNYPSTTSGVTGAAADKTYYLPASAVTVVTGATALTSTSTEKSIRFLPCPSTGTTTGYQIEYFDYAAGNTKTIVGGTQASCATSGAA